MPGRIKRAPQAPAAIQTMTYRYPTIAPRSKAKNWLKLVFVVAACWLLVNVINSDKLLQFVANISLPWFSVAVLLTLADTLLMGLKWNILLKALNVKVSRYATILAYLRSRVFVFVAPSTLGVDSYKVYFLKTVYGCAVAPVTSSIVIERVLGLLSSLGIPFLLLWFAIGPFFGANNQGSILIMGLAGFIGLLLLTNLLIRFSYRQTGASLPFRLPVPVKQALSLLSFNLKKVEGNEDRLWLYFTLSMLEKLFYGCAIYMSARAIGLEEVDFMYIIAATPFLALLERLPISFSTIGVREGMYVLLFAPYYSDATVAVCIALTMRSAEIVQVLLFSFVWLLKPGLPNNNNAQDPAGHYDPNPDIDAPSCRNPLHKTA